MPAPLVALAIQQAIQVGVQVAASKFSQGSSGGDDAKAAGSRITNEIESAMDLNRAAFESGTIPIDEFDPNWKALWMAFEQAAEQIGTVQPEFARRMIADRVRGGQFGDWWQGGLHENPLNWARGKVDSSGFILPEFQKPWPLKAKFVDTDPYAQIRSRLPSVQQALEQAGKTGPPPGVEIRAGTGTLIDKIKQAGAGTLLAGGAVLVVGIALIGGKWKG